MISLWLTIGLILAAVSVSSLGAFFSIDGLGLLFSGAVVAVWVMAGSLEFAKFVLAAYLHQTWSKLNKIYRAYLVFSVVTLSIITSIGVFGFLSQAYQSASSVLEAENIKLKDIETQKKLAEAEIARLNRSLDEIPASRVTKRLQALAQIEPAIQALNKKIQEGEKQLSQANLTVLDVKKKVGPLIFISRSLNMDIDIVVRYLILVFVSVFDPLAICLVIAATNALETRRKGFVVYEKDKITVKPESVVTTETVSLKVVPPTEEAQPEVKKVEEVAKVAKVVEEPVVAKAQEPAKVEAVAAEAKSAANVKELASEESDDVIVQMNFKEEEKEEQNPKQAV